MFKMTRHFLIFMILHSGSAGQQDGNFPLHDCDTGQFDILLVESRKIYVNGYYYTPFVLDKIAEIWTDGEINNSRIRFSRVLATNKYNTYNCSAELFRHGNHTAEFVDICRKAELITSLNLTLSRSQRDLIRKIKIAKSILPDVIEGRNNSTRVAIVTVDNEPFLDLTADDIRSIPDILNQESSEIKVFVIIFNTIADLVFLRDTIITSEVIMYQAVYMALCNRCKSGWFFLKQANFMSCYKLQTSPNNVDWYEASRTCSENGMTLAAVESKEELVGLQEHLFADLLTKRQNANISSHSSSFSAVVYIDLQRYASLVAKQFFWIHQYRYLPVVVNHWLPGNPNGIISHSCGVWRYTGFFNYTVPVGQVLDNTSTVNSQFLDYKSKNSEGWSSVGCGIRLSKFSLCEISLSRYVDRKDKIEQTNKDSYNKVLNRSDFAEFEGKIVSVSAFLNVLKNKQEDTPLFDCGDDGIWSRFISYSYFCENEMQCNTEGDGTRSRYIPYSYVCDNEKQCKSGIDETECKLPDVYNCWSGEKISVFAKCDMIKDCLDGSDEAFCTQCRGRRCCDGTCLPSHLFNDGEIDCNDCKTIDNITVINEPKYPKQSSAVKEKCAFICNRDECIYPSQLNDGHLDCVGPEGPMDETIGKLEKFNSCPVTLGRLVWAPRCVYLRDIYGSVLGCGDLSHLQNCSDFPCQEGYYKCSGSYCIPLHYVMNGWYDCPAGEDEIYPVSHTCIGNFACWGTDTCLHPDLVCDGAVHCRYRDDELGCDVSCMKGFHCIAGTITLEKNTLIQFDTLKFTYPEARYIDLSGVDMSRISSDSIEVNTTLCYDLRLSRCAIKDIYNVFPFHTNFLKNVQRIDLSYNLLTSFTEDGSGQFFNLQLLNISFNRNLIDFSVQRLKWLKIVDISYTGLSMLGKRSFEDLPRITHLNLSHTRISTFCRHIFPPDFSLEVLDLRGSPITTYYKNTYNGLRIISALYTDNFGLCCPQVRGNNILGDMCHSTEVVISSCFDLIGVEVQRILLWLMAGAAIFGNLVVILYRLFWDKSVLKRAYVLFVLNLGISDLLMGLYLLIIAVADVYYRGVYVLHDKEWKQSNFCRAASFLATLSSETSGFFIFLITVDRFLVLKFPYGDRKFSRNTKVLVTVLAWCFGFVLAMIPCMPIFGHETLFTSSAMCIGLPLTNLRLNGWGYSLGVFIVLNCIMFFFTAFGQVWIFRSISENRISKESTNQNSLRRAQDITVAKELSLVILSDFLCWFPVALMGFLSVAGHEISNNVYVWTVVLVIPVNSAINPVLYTIPILMAKWKAFKHGK